jgi:hypothetical protein
VGLSTIARSFHYTESPASDQGGLSIHQTGAGNGNGGKNGKYMMQPVIRIVSFQ